METTFTSIENSKTNEHHKFILKTAYNLNLEDPNKKYAIVTNLTIYYTWKNVKSEYKNNIFRTSAPTWNDEFDLSDESYSVSDIQDYFE